MSPQFFVKSNAHEYLIVGRGGAIRNRGPAASAFLPPGATHVLVPSTQQEAIFEMRQESKDGIPLRFKGSAIYWIDEPVTAAKHYDFTQGAAAGVAEIHRRAQRGVLDRGGASRCSYQYRAVSGSNTPASSLKTRRSRSQPTMCAQSMPSPWSVASSNIHASTGGGRQAGGASWIAARTKRLASPGGRASARRS